MPTAQELLEALETMTELDEASKQEIRDSILRGAAFQQGQAEGGFQPPVAEAVGTNITVELAMLLTLISLVLLVLGEKALIYLLWLSGLFI